MSFTLAVRLVKNTESHVEETDDQQMIEQEKEHEIVIVYECTHWLAVYGQHLTTG